MEKFRERVAILLKAKRISIATVAGGRNSLQIKFTRQINGTSTISFDVIKAILDYFPEISAEWLMRGEGDMYRVVPKSEVKPESSSKTTVSLFDGPSSFSGDTNKRLLEAIQGAIEANNEYIKILARMQEENPSPLASMADTLIKNIEAKSGKSRKDSVRKEP